MERSKLIRTLHMECPLCDKVHDIEERRRITATIIKGEQVSYEEIYYFCSNSKVYECEFAPAGIENKNMLNARNAYRRTHNLLTSDEIVEIRERYGLSQIDLAKLLGWGEATISRYESKAIQDDAYDTMLRIVRDNPFKAYELLQKNINEFTHVKYIDIKAKITDSLDSYGREYLKRQALESEYVNYQELSVLNGYQSLDIDKIESMVSYFARKIDGLYKVKLMKLLWFSDALCFKKTGKSMTGLVYCHDGMGALPIGHYKLIGLENVLVQEEEGYDFTKYHILSNDEIDLNCFSAEEKAVLDLVIAKFKDYTTPEIVNYMHEERAYKETKDKEIISFDLAKEIREF